MTKILGALAGAALIASAAFAPSTAEARGGAVAAGILGGLAAGAIIAGAAGAYPAPPPPAYYGYSPYPVANCGWRSERYWDGWGWRWHRVRVCY